MSQAQAYRSQKDFERSLPGTFSAALGEHVEKARIALARRDAAAQAELEGRVNALKTPASQLSEAAARVLGEELQEETAAMADRARALLLQGAYVPQFLFSGAASRLGVGPMYFADVRRLAEELPGAGEAGASQADGPKFHLGLGPRQLLQYRLRLEAVAAELAVDPAAPLAKAPVVIHLPESGADAVLEDVWSRAFYGFSPRNVYFLTQPTLCGLSIDGRRLVEDPASPRLPAGHGYPLMQFFQRETAFRLEENGPSFLRGDLYSSLLRGGALVMAAHRVNDLARLGPEVVDLERLAFALVLMDDLRDPAKGRNMVVELAANPENQKGGFWKLDKTTGRRALAETLNLQTPELKAFTATLTQPPYNAFRNLYKFPALEALASRGFTPFIRFRHDHLYPETVTGEATEVPEMSAEAFRKTGETVHDFKDRSGIPEALRYIALQDADPAFSSLARKLGIG